MSARGSSGLIASLGLHGAAVTVALLVAYAADFDRKKEPSIFVLTGAKGDHVTSTASLTPSLSGIKVDIPATPLPAVAPQAPTSQVPAPEPVEPEPAPQPPKPKPALKPIPKSPASAPRPKAGPTSAATTPASSTPTSPPRTPTTSTGSQAGPVLPRPDGPVMDAYFAYLKQELLKSLKRTLPPGLGDTLSVEVEFLLSANGSLSAAKVVTSSGNVEFDRAALDACSLLGQITARPDKDSSVIALRFRTKDLEGN